MTNVRLPINIALVLKGEGDSLVRKLNNDLEYNENDQILLGTKKNFPHVTMGMLVVNDHDLGKLEELVSKIEYPKEIVLIQSKVVERTGVSLNYLEVEATNEIKQLHEEVCSLLEQFPRLEARHSLFPEEVSDSIVDYVNSFDKVSGQNYWPHVTLGYGKGIALVESFRAEVQLELCLIGNHGVCHSCV